MKTQTPAIDKAMRIFEHLARRERATFTEIQRTADLPKSTASSLLASLAAHGLVKLEAGQYSLGLRWYEYGSRVEAELDIGKVALPPLTRLRDAIGLTCHLGVREGAAAIYVLKLDSPSPIVIRSWVGRRLSLHSSGLGKALLAWLPGDQLADAVADIDFERRTPTTIASPEAYMAELAATRARGWAYDDGEDYEGVHCIAAPVRGSAGEVIAAISVSGVSSQVNVDNRDALAGAVTATATEISEGYARRGGAAAPGADAKRRFQ